MTVLRRNPLMPCRPRLSSRTRALCDSPKKKSYYQIIEGVKYDRSALEAAHAAVAGRGDGRVSLEDARAIYAEMIDGGGVTKIEFRTAFKILADFNFTDEAREGFISALAKAK